MIDPACNEVNRLFFLSFENEEDRTSFSNFSKYTPNVEIKYFNVSIDGKSFLDVQVKKQRRNYEKINEMSKNSDYTTGNLWIMNTFQSAID